MDALVKFVMDFVSLHSVVALVVGVMFADKIKSVLRLK